MSPERKQTINGHVIAEYYWAGSYPIYVDNHLFDGDWDAAIEHCSKTKPAPGLEREE